MERDEAVDATALAWEQVEAAEGEVGRIRAEMEAVGEAAAKEAEDHELRLEGLRIGYEAALAEATEARQRADGALDQLRAELVTADERHQAQLTTLRRDAEDAVAGARAEGEERLRVALEDQAAHLAEARLEEIGRLVAQIEGLRAALSRGVD